ncbi:MAG TPA: alpha/beta fold hydrolase [Candidatus Polarisedimenticolia bacterium]|nr:alpha/beta fold hydrolase [Candidatus Polarisedimenticolia bacterium]
MEPTGNSQKATPRRRGSAILGVGRQFLRLLLYGLPAIVITVLGGYIVWSARRGPELSPWHTARLAEEFTAADAGRVRTFDDYRGLEDRLFAALRHEVYDRVAPSERRSVNRYSAGSLADPGEGADNLNRSYELPAANPRAVAVLLHGLTDSPYVLRRLGERLNADGVYVVGLRLPGHGTAPAALTRTTYQDWAAAVRLAARHARARVGDGVPLWLVGFSTGAALAVEYSLARLEGEDLPEPAGLVLLSPAIGVDPAAPVSIAQEWLSHLPGLGKLAWLSIDPEFDPCKYNSFPTNAGAQIYRLTRKIDERFDRLSPTGGLHGFPRTLAFQSVADSTVSARAVARAFLDRLAPEGHALVAFDINRTAEVEPIMVAGAGARAELLLRGPALTYDMTLLTNATPETRALVAKHRKATQAEVVDTPTDLSWPPGIFSLSHLALPVSPEDPIYGANRPTGSRRIYLGRIELLGENGLLALPTSALLRLRFNPFYSYVETRILEFMALSDKTESGGG